MTPYMPYALGIAISALIVAVMAVWRQERIRRDIKTLDTILLGLLKRADSVVPRVVPRRSHRARVPPPAVEVRCSSCAGEGSYTAGSLGDVSCEVCGGAGVVTE